MRRFIALTIAAAVLVPASAAQAGSFGKPCTTKPANEWLSVEVLQSKLEEQGYKVRKGKIKNSCGEFYTTNPSGQKIELFLDPATGAIVGQS
ncbi:MAG: PepSY domain-containing protein [Hyphomicrobiaceae bacterium]